MSTPAQGAPEVAVYGTFNSRSTPAADVAENFVAPAQFWQVVPASNAVLTGPRGSGKTTLLKMLTPSGLDTWKDPRAPQARASARYTGVFVPADRSWAGQIRTYDRALGEELHGQLGQAIFVLHVLRALVSTAHFVVHSPSEHRPAPISPQAEQDIARSLFGHWPLDGVTSSFAAVRQQLSDNVALLGRLARRAHRRPSAIDAIQDHSAMDLDVIDAAGQFIDRFNDAMGDDDHVWMLLIDEIEFLPEAARESMIEALRGRDPRIMQKISYAPYTDVFRQELLELGGWAGQDFQRIDLTFPEKEGGFGFSRELMRRDMAKRGVGIEPAALLGGKGFFESVDEDGQDRYSAKTRNGKAIASLSRKDPSFDAWCRQHGIDPADPALMKGTDRAKTLRKAMPVILIRDELLRAGTGGVTGRSRRSGAAPLYTGEYGVFAVCENNPRLLKALTQRFIDAYVDDGELTLTEQARIIARHCEEYLLHLRAIEVGDDLLPAEYLPKALIDRVGHAFREGVLGPDFSPEPALSFIAPDLGPDAPASLQALGQVIDALHNYGAIVPLGSPSERRFGLSHMFAPVYQLPLRRGRPVQLLGLLPAELQTASLDRQLPLELDDLGTT